jgi:NADH-quinone oxidoreductase subunit K
MIDANIALTQNLLIFGGVLFAFGMIGFLTRRSLILMFLSLELMLAGVSVNLIAFSRFHQNYQGQIFTIMILTVAACEAALALALVTSLFRRHATLDARVWSRLNDYDAPPEAESAEAIIDEEQEFPKLTPAGLDPAAQPLPSRGEKGWNRPYSEEESVEEVSGRA